MNTELLTRIIILCIAALVMLIAGSAFILSYVNLRLTAISAGIPDDLAFLWPVCLDAFLILSSLDILRANLTDESSKWGWVILVCFTIISTGFNMLGSLGNVGAMIAHAVPPVSLCISLEVLMRIIHGDAQPLLKPEQSEANHDLEVCSPVQEAINNDPVVRYYVQNPCTPYSKAARELEKDRMAVTRRVRQAITSGELNPSCLPPKAKSIDDNIPVG